MTKRSERAQALELRRQGISYYEIMQRLDIAKSTLWRWLKSEGMVDPQYQHFTELKRIAQRKAVAVIKASRLARTRTTIEQAKAEVGDLSRRDLWLIGVVLYWAEGTKQKPHNVAQRVAFSNSDPAMVRLFMIWLREICQLSAEQLSFELYIHESGNIESARTFWAATLQVPVQRLRVRLKRHNLSPHRRNIGERYVGLVRITVPRSVNLNRRIAGWVDGVCRCLGESANGKPSDFGSEYPGSIPGSPAILLEPGVDGSDRLWGDQLVETLGASLTGDIGHRR